MVELVKESLHRSVSDPAVMAMNFLNEVAERFPDAISLAAGRPYEDFYTADDIERYLRIYFDHLRGQGLTEAQVRTVLMQYGRTNGHIHRLVATLLATDEGIDVPAEAVAVTVGCQEAMVIALRGLCAGPSDVLLVPLPCYVGITGAARVLDIEVVGVPEGPDGLDPRAVAAAARSVRAAGRRPRAFYVIPDFANPSGRSLDLDTRRELLDVARAEDLLVLEDNPYGLFDGDDRPRPSLKSMDGGDRVIYLGSFAKSCFPGARVGFLVADQTVVDRAGRRTLLAEELSGVKSMITVNTSAVSQAVIGGMLVESRCSLRAANRAKVAFYRRNLKALLDALDHFFPEPARTARGVGWNVPSGGFFAVLDVPVRADENLLEISAREYGVLWTPVSFFYSDGGGTHAIRLACSALEPAQVGEGVRRLARLLAEHGSDGAP